MRAAKRQAYDGAVYHIIQRGNNRQTLFRSDSDYEKFLELLEKYASRYSFELYNYCLMKNHVHLLAKIFKKKELKKLTQGIFQSFSLYFKKKYQYVGHLYQGRYKSKIIEKNEYLLECARYIETNPLRAKIVKNLKDYKWSSYNFYAYGHPNPLLTPNPLYDTSGNSKEVRKRYREYTLFPRMYEDIIDGFFGIK